MEPVTGGLGSGVETSMGSGVFVGITVMITVIITGGDCGGYSAGGWGGVLAVWVTTASHIARAITITHGASDFRDSQKLRTNLRSVS